MTEVTRRFDAARPSGADCLTLVERTRRWARSRGERRAYTFLGRGEEPVESLTYADLDRRARAVGAFLGEAGLRGERVLLIFPPGVDFIVSFLGCLYAGAVAVPSYPPRPHRATSRLLEGIVRSAAPALALTDSTLPSQIVDRLEETSPLRAIRWLSVGEISPAAADRWRQPAIGRDDLALLQYTSGSTGEPKGVEVTHGNLVHNEVMIQTAMGQGEDIVMATWLPVYHDMGLIGNVLHSLYLGGSCVLMSPFAFLQQPVRWLRVISRYRATMSGGPNFAFELCIERIPPEQRRDLDLSSWSTAFNGSEPVRYQTVERFFEAFAPCGLRREALYPCYGLAEATLLVSGGPPNRGPVSLEVDFEALQAGRIEPPNGGQKRTLMSSGEVSPEQRLRIVHPETASPCDRGRVGEIWIAGRAVAAGYWRRPAETAEVFGAVLAGGEDGPYLRTGDLGFIDDGQLFVVGRLKDLIIIAGRNHYPQDIELTAERSGSGVRAGCCAAFSVEVDDWERLVLLLETRRDCTQDPLAIARDARRAIAEHHDLEVYRLEVLPPGSLPKTTSGKIRRRACRQRFLAGALGGGAVSEGAAEGAAPPSDATSGTPGAARIPGSRDDQRG